MDANWRLGELHLTPVHSTVQMRPAFKYIDKIDEKFKAANKRIQDVEKEEDETKKKAESGKAQTLQVRGNIDERGSGQEGRVALESGAYWGCG